MFLFHKNKYEPQPRTTQWKVPKAQQKCEAGDICRSPCFSLPFFFCGPPFKEESAPDGAEQAAAPRAVHIDVVAAWRDEEAAFGDHSCKTRTSRSFRDVTKCSSPPKENCCNVGTTPELNPELICSLLTWCTPLHKFGLWTTWLTILAPLFQKSVGFFVSLVREKFPEHPAVGPAGSAGPDFYVPSSLSQHALMTSARLPKPEPTSPSSHTRKKLTDHSAAQHSTPQKLDILSTRGIHALGIFSKSKESANQKNNLRMV